jgi:hypothetical protein
MVTGCQTKSNFSQPFCSKAQLLPKNFMLQRQEKTQAKEKIQG